VHGSDYRILTPHTTKEDNMMNPQNLVQLLEQDLNEKPPSRKYTPEAWDTIRTWLETQQGNLRALAKQHDAILRNPKWTDQGRQEQFGKLGKDFLNQFKGLKRELADREATLARNRRTLFHVESPVKDDVLKYFRAKEIRDDFRDADPGERVQMFLDAAEQNKEEILASVLDAPGVPLIAEEHTSAAMMDRAERLFGQEGGLLDTYREQTSIHEYMSGWRNWIGLCLEGLGVDRQQIDATLGPVPETPPAPQPTAAGV
jgi:hypothetical protein